MTEKAVEDIVKKIIPLWEHEINSINIDGYCRQIESVDWTRIKRYYDKEEVIKFCYRVTFNFKFREESHSNSVSDIKREFLHEKWNDKLQHTFVEMFWNKSCEPKPITSSTENTHLYTSEWKFFNNRVDYIDYVGPKFIIQFYPQGFISDLRHQKLNDLVR